MSRTRPSKEAAVLFVQGRCLYRRFSSQRSHRLAEQSQDMLNDAVEEASRLPVLQADYDLCYGNGVASQPYDEDAWYFDLVDVLSDYEWQLRADVKPAALNARWSTLPSAWDDKHARICRTDRQLQAKLKQGGLQLAKLVPHYDYFDTECFSYSYNPRKRHSMGFRKLRHCVGFDLYVPACTCIDAPSQSPLLGKLTLVACCLGADGLDVFRVPASNGWVGKLPRGWLLVNSTNFTLAELSAVQDL